MDGWIGRISIGGKKVLGVHEWVDEVESLLGV